MVDDEGRAARRWDARVSDWDEHVTDSPAFARVRAALLAAAQVDLTDRCVDLGAGTGFATLPIARTGARVLAVDASTMMLTRLDQRAHAEGLSNISTRVSGLATCRLPPASVEVAVSLYALHHLTHRAKRDLVTRARDWLTPGGRLVIADMMFGHGGSARDRELYIAKARALVRRGPSGWWRIAKNTVRFGLGIGSGRPASPQFWTSALLEAGFRNVHYTPIVGEAGLVVGIAPGIAPDPRSPSTVHAFATRDDDPRIGRHADRRRPPARWRADPCA